jgi:hypothetical protein
LLDRAASVGLDALAVTDHDVLDASLRAADRAADYGLVGIPGMEITSAAGHVLALGVTERVPAGLGFDETVARVREAGGLVVVPHPFQRSRHGVGARVTRRQLATVDAVEVYNSRLLTGLANRRARSFAASNGLPMTAGSDAHIAEMVGRAVTGVDAEERTPQAVLEAISAGRTAVSGRPTPRRISARQATGNATRRVLRTLGEWL